MLPRKLAWAKEICDMMTYQDSLVDAQSLHDLLGIVQDETREYQDRE
jgi:hypothetical protein